MKHLFFIIITVVSLNQVISQNFKFGKVSKEELQEKFHPIDSSASAAVLYRHESISFYFTESDGFMQQREIHERIKVYNKDGFDWATKKEYLYQGSSRFEENMSGLKGVTFNYVDGKIIKDKLSSEGKFNEDYNEYTKINSFTMPNIKEGSVIEYKYKITTGSLGIDDIIFQYRIPINKLDVKIATPEYYVYKKQMNLKASYYPKIKESAKNLTVPFKYIVNIISAEETDVPALRAEAYAGNINNYRSKMALELSAILNTYKVVEKSFSSSWEEVTKTIYKSDNFGGQLSRSNFYKDDINTLLSSVTDDFQKAFLVENLVKSKVKWNGNYSKYTQKGIRSAYKEGVGNVADINLLVTSMLRSQGIKAYPVLISTRNNGIPLFPTREGFNYVICMVKKGESYMLIDATEPFSTNNVLPERVLNWRGRVITEDGNSQWINIMSQAKSLESTRLNVKINDDFSVSGKVSKSLNSYSALRYRNKYALTTEEDHIKALESDKGDLEIAELNFENKKDITEPVKVSYEYELSDGVDEVGDKLYFSPLLFLALKENPFKLEERQYPIDFIMPYEDKYLINIMLPEGYNVESLPENEIMEFKDGDAKFQYILRENGRYLQLKVNLDINNPIIGSLDYKVFKSFFSSLVEKQAEQIVLTKA
ncbi:transglutaminase domain-containing protein [Winogradskyella sp.]|uniref:transglutaminase domain-containing protein n=1 Tax=Winogradskyella sp. TaxID=1883156 RepID=UPI0025E976F5|nr:transglutaminase domain-containing protein [Winogradskyella sp.]